MKFTALCQPIFEAAINDYHKADNVDTPINNPYQNGIEHALNPFLFVIFVYDIGETRLFNLRR